MIYNLQMLEVGIVGLPNVGKSTLFNLLSHIGVPAQNYPFCTIDKNEAVVEYKDPVLENLGRALGSSRLVYPTFKFVDIAGLVQGASKGEGLGNQFLAHIREVDLILFVLRGFTDPKVVNVMGSIDPVRDLDILLTELILKDLESVTTKLEEVTKHRHRYKGKDYELIHTTLTELQQHLQTGHLALVYILKILRKHLRQVQVVDLFRLNSYREEYLELKVIYDLFLLTAKPFVILLNVSYESMSDKAYSQALEEYKQDLQAYLSKAGISIGIPTILLDIRFLKELEELSPDEQTELVADLPFFNDISVLFKEVIRFLQLKRIYVGGKVDARCFLVFPETTVKQAAGLIHSDLEAGFIKAKITKVSNIIEKGGITGVHFAIVGPDYIMQDQDYFIVLANN